MSISYHQPAKRFAPPSKPGKPFHHNLVIPVLMKSSGRLKELVTTDAGRKQLIHTKYVLSSMMTHNFFKEYVKTFDDTERWDVTSLSHDKSYGGIIHTLNDVNSSVSVLIEYTYSPSCYYPVDGALKCELYYNSQVCNNAITGEGKVYAYLILTGTEEMKKNLERLRLEQESNKVLNTFLSLY